MVIFALNYSVYIYDIMIKKNRKEYKTRKYFKNINAIYIEFNDEKCSSESVMRLRFHVIDMK